MKIVSVFLFILIATIVNGQVFQHWRTYISAGIGTGNLSSSVFKEAVKSSNRSNLIHRTSGPFYLKYEYGLSDVIGLGLNYAYLKDEVTFTQQTNSGLLNAKVGRRTQSLLLRFNFHLSKSEVVDPYIGLGLGFRTASWFYEDNKGGNDFLEQDFNVSRFFPLGAELTFGTRLMLSPNIGAYTEIGISKGIIQVGLTGSF
jgi:hypothetical protein